MLNLIFHISNTLMGFSGNAKGLNSSRGLERSPGEGNDYPLQYFGLEKSMDKGTWQGYSPWGCKESDTTE